jgi:hypothetical protein
MNWPLPPTDNLYKFIAITGLTIVGFSVFYWAKTYHDWTQISAKAMAAGEGLLSQSETLRQSEIWLLTNDDPEAKHLLGTILTNHLALGFEMVKFGGALKQARTESDFMLRELVVVTIITAVGFFGGIWIAIIGFRHWYYRVQVHLDKILEEEASKPK